MVKVEEINGNDNGNDEIGHTKPDFKGGKKDPTSNTYTDVAVWINIGRSDSKIPGEEYLSITIKKPNAVIEKYAAFKNKLKE